MWVVPLSLRLQRDSELQAFSCVLTPSYALFRWRATLAQRFDERLDLCEGALHWRTHGFVRLAQPPRHLRNTGQQMQSHIYIFVFWGGWGGGYVGLISG